MPVRLCHTSARRGLPQSHVMKEHVFVWHRVDRLVVVVQRYREKIEIFGINNKKNLKINYVYTYCCPIKLNSSRVHV